MLEIESKHIVRGGQSPSLALRKVLKILKRAGFDVQAGATERLKDTYLDTIDGSVHRAGWSCRVRDYNDGRLLVSLKSHKQTDHDVFRRDEIAQTFYRPLPPDWATKPGQVSDELARILPPEAHLTALFNQRTKRQQYRLTRPDVPRCEVNLSMDHVALKRLGMRYVELELELACGPESILGTLAALLKPLPELVTARMSKYDRALFSLDPKPTAIASNDIDTQTWQQRGLEYLGSQLKQLERYEPFAWEGVHAEGVHQLRVATRRLLAGLQAFDNVMPIAETTVLRTHTREMTKHLGDVRDLDVHLHDLATRKIDKRYLGNIAKARCTAHTRLTAFLARGAIAGLQADFANLVDVSRSAQESTLRVDQAMESKVLPQLKALVRLGSIIERSDTGKMHKLRLAVRDLGYQLECLPNVPQALTDAVSKLRDILGRHQDAHVAIRYLRESQQSKGVNAHIIRCKKRVRRTQRRLSPAWQHFLRELDAYRR